jgi:Fic family protein
MKVRLTNDIKQWFKFFLVGIIETAKGSIETFDNIMKLQKEVDDKIQRFGSRAHNARVIIHQLYLRPLINVQKVASLTKLSLPSAYKLVSDLEEFGILKEITGAKRGKNYLFDDYIKLFK